jgi:hypothetical protein
MQAADAVYLDRRDGRTAPLGQRQLLPAFPHPVGGGPEVPVEVAPVLGRAAASRSRSPIASTRPRAIASAETNGRARSSVAMRPP